MLCSRQSIKLSRRDVKKNMLSPLRAFDLEFWVMGAEVVAIVDTSTRPPVQISTGVN
jgi:hypothetical protein